MLENPQLEVGVHVGVLIEGGSHASCTDKYNDGTPDTTNTGAWGLQWGTVPSDYTGIKIPVVVGFIHPWNLITVWLTPWDQGERIEYNEAHYTLKEITSDFIGEFGGLERFDDPITPIYLVNPVPGGITTPIPIDGEPPTHPWTQTRYNNPYDIIPILDRFITGTVSGSDTISAIIVILSEEPYYTFADENGNFLLNNVPYGVHDVVVNLDGYAPYKQRFIHIENTTLGVDGILNIIPEEEAFRIEGTATDIEESIIPNATINAYDESGSNLFTTLTDENGTYLVTASAEHVYTVEAITDVGIAIVHNVSGVAGSVVNADIAIVGKKGIVECIDTKLQDLIEEVNGLDINKGIKNSLLSKLENAISKNDQALEFIEDGKESHANNMLNAEDNLMNAFINEVEAQSGKKIAEEDAAKLKGKDKDIRALIQLAIETPI